MTCITCKFKFDSDCRRFPPLPVVTTERVGHYQDEKQVDSYWGFPQVYNDHPRCGEYKQKAET